MADIRFKDLTTTASTTAADDFFAADGATNGTRKLSAYSPSFGGNATVGGTLTVNSTDDASNKDTGSLVLEGGLGVEKNIISGLGLSVRGAVTLPTAWTGAYGLGFEYGSAISRVFFGDGTGYSLKFVSRASSTTTDRMTLTDSGVLSVLGTTASTSTSSGALVVGNGTSGGLGVGGAANIGGALSMYGEDFTIHNVGYGSWVLRNTAGSAVFDIRNGAGSWLTFPNLAGTVEFKTLATTVKVSATTASTSTSSGALVVSGGVGVAKSINAGESGSTHNFIGGDGGSGSTILAIKDSSSNSKVIFEGAGDVQFLGTIKANASSNAFRIANSQTPASASATGTAGTIAWDTSYIYVCTATNTWKRAALSTW
jgi:hypothetical protein